MQIIKMDQMNNKEVAIEKLVSWFLFNSPIDSSIGEIYSQAMPDEEDIQKIWSKIIEIGIQVISEKIENLGIPIVKGQITANHGTFIAIENSDIDKYKDLYSPGSICVIDSEYVNADDDGDYLLSAFSVQIRLGTSNTWLCAGLKNHKSDGDEEDEFDDYEDEEDETIDAVTIERVAAIVANSPGFGELRNKNQRQDFTRPIVYREISEDISEFRIRNISELAESFFELGLVPMKAKKLKSEGKTITEIAKLMNITKQKAERAVNAEIPKYIEDNLHLTDLKSQT